MIVGKATRCPRPVLPTTVSSPMPFPTTRHGKKYEYITSFMYFYFNPNLHSAFRLSLCKLSGVVLGKPARLPCRDDFEESFPRIPRLTAQETGHRCGGLTARACRRAK